MISKENMKALEDSGIDYILGVKIRNVKEVYDDILLRGGRGQGYMHICIPANCS